MDIQGILFTIAQCAPGFLLAIVVHEWSHGYVAKRFGDPTAENSGRLTLNPSVHIDPMGTIIFPLIGVLLGWAVFGWARPVPVDSRNFKNQRKAIFWVSFAGPLSNFILGTLSALLFAILSLYLPSDLGVYPLLLKMLNYSIFINFLLGGFNLIPLPPLDGSRMGAAFLKGETLRLYESIQNYTPMIFLAIIALSFMGISTIGKVLTPITLLGQKVTMLFLYILS